MTQGPGHDMTEVIAELAESSHTCFAPDLRHLRLLGDLGAWPELFDNAADIDQITLDEVRYVHKYINIHVCNIYMYGCLA